MIVPFKLNAFLKNTLKKDCYNLKDCKIPVLRMKGISFNSNSSLK